MLLADFGADVIKVEKPGKPDPIGRERESHIGIDGRPEAASFGVPVRPSRCWWLTRRCRLWYRPHLRDAGLIQLFASERPTQLFSKAFGSKNRCKRPAERAAGVAAVNGLGIPHPIQLVIRVAGQHRNGGLTDFHRHA